MFFLPGIYMTFTFTSVPEKFFNYIEVNWGQQVQETLQWEPKEQKSDSITTTNFLNEPYYRIISDIFMF